MKISHLEFPDRVIVVDALDFELESLVVLDVQVSFFLRFVWLRCLIIHHV